MYKIYECLSEMAELLEEKINFEIKNQGTITNEKCKNNLYVYHEVKIKII